MNESRRDFLKLAGYAAPVIITLNAMPAYAQAGSGLVEERLRGNNGIGNFEDPAPPGIAKQGLPQNDEIIVGPPGGGVGGPDYNGGGPK
jgi:hypothetical protein